MAPPRQGAGSWRPIWLSSDGGTIAWQNNSGETVCFESRASERDVGEFVTLSITTGERKIDRVALSTDKTCLAVVFEALGDPELKQNGMKNSLGSYDQP